MCGNILVKRKYCRYLIVPLIINSILFKQDIAVYPPKGSYRSLLLFSLTKINTYSRKKLYWFSCQNEILQPCQKEQLNCSFIFVDKEILKIQTYSPFRYPSSCSVHRHRSHMRGTGWYLVWVDDLAASVVDLRFGATLL